MHIIGNSIKIATFIAKNLHSEEMKSPKSWSWSPVYPVLQYHRERPSLLDLLSEFGLISDGWLSSRLYLLREIEPMHLNVEGLRPWDWSYPVLQYLREWPTPTVIIFDMALSLSPQNHPAQIVSVSVSSGTICPWWLVVWGLTTVPYHACNTGQYREHSG